MKYSNIGVFFSAMEDMNKVLDRDIERWKYRTDYDSSISVTIRAYARQHTIKVSTETYTVVYYYDVLDNIEHAYRYAGIEFQSVFCKDLADGVQEYIATRYRPQT